MTASVRLIRKSAFTAWDRVALTYSEGNVDHLHVFADRYSCLELYRQLNIGYFRQHQGVMTLSVDERTFHWSEDLWRQVHAVLDVWFEQYMVIVEFRE